ncbi:hypothetical protein E2C01_045684 [Portunus trituberculatus]|uniref:Uncharacterized protein n=1 Tax=Portunus trituberculatus TaxID=210409 RepID=A0A5B7G2Q0_PORTR|nr:hypothetical protein [Portunus trituberculatus]
MNSTSCRHVQLVKKPAYAVMGLLSLLGDRSIRHTLQGFDDRLSVIASCRHCHSKVATSLSIQEVHDQSGADPETGSEGEAPDHDLHVYSGDNSPEMRASRRNTRRTHTHADRKRGSTVDAKFVGEASVAAAERVFGRDRSRLRSQASHTQRPPSTGIGGDATVMSSFETNEGVAAFPQPEEGGNEIGRREMDADMENEELKEDTAEREGNGREIEKRDTKKVQENENGEERVANNENTEDSDEMKGENEERLEQEEEKHENGEKEEAEEEERREKKGDPPGAAWEAAVVVSLTDGQARSPPGACRKVAVEVNIPSFLVGGKQQPGTVTRKKTNVLCLTH